MFIGVAVLSLKMNLLIIQKFYEGNMKLITGTSFMSVGI